MGFASASSMIILALAWLWFVSIIGVEWTSNVTFEKRRMSEARLVVETVCSTIKGAGLAREFAKCEEAHIMLADSKLIWIKAFEKTIRNVAYKAVNMTGKISLAALGNIAMIMIAMAGVVVLCNTLTHAIEGSREIDVFSPIAQARLHSYVDLGVSNKIKAM
jgi:hypothetical protein